MNKYNRTADDAIYVQDRYGTPKESFKQIVSLLKLDQKENKDSNKKLLDIGCATGELLYYIRGINPAIRLAGIEYSENLVRRAKDFLASKDISISAGDANDLKIPDSQYDFVVSSGVTTIFNDFRPSFEEMIRVAKDGATCLNLMMVNELDLDVIIQYINPATGKMESGWNKFSLKSIGGFLKNHDNVKSYRFIKHEMPFDLPMQADLMRSWTVTDKNGKRILWNGLNMEISTYHIIFQIEK